MVQLNTQDPSLSPWLPGVWFKNIELWEPYISSKTSLVRTSEESPNAQQCLLRHMTSSNFSSMLLMSWVAIKIVLPSSFISLTVAIMSFTSYPSFFNIAITF